MADGNALAIVIGGRTNNLSKIKIKNHAAAIHGKWKDEIGIEVTFIPIQHEIGILPKIVSAVTLACGGGISVGAWMGGFHRAGLQRIAVFVFDGVIRVVEDTVQALVQMRDVIAAIEIVIHIYFPVAIEIVDAALEKMEIAQLERLYTSGQPTQKIAQRFREIVEVHENKIFPRIHARRHQANLRAIKA